MLLQPQKESHYLVLMKQLCNLDYELSAEESVLINFGRLITLVFFIGIKIIFVVLYKVKKGKTFYIADPAKGLVKYNLEEFKKHWISTHSGGEEKGIAMFLEPTPAFYEKQTDEQPTEERSFKFLFGYIKQYRKYFGQIVLGLLVGSLLQLILPFLTQSIVDVGIKNQNIGFIWLILLGQLMLTISRTAIDFIRRWLLLHISLRINISLVSDFFHQALKAAHVLLRHQADGRPYAAYGRPQPCKLVSDTTNAQYCVLAFSPL